MKNLIIYFSHTGENYMRDGIRNITKGNTEIVAEEIQKAVGGDLFKVERVENYPYEYYACCDEAKKENNTNARPKIKKELKSISEYDHIYIGYPIWWGTMPMPMFTALENLDFTGKYIHPFCTHEGSGLGHSESDLRKLCKGAIITQGLAIRGSDASTSSRTISAYAKSQK